MRKAFQYLGFEVNNEVDEYDYVEEDMAPVAHIREAVAEETPVRAAVAPAAPLAAASRPATDLRRIQTIKPRSYNDARLIGEAFRQGVPVIINLTEMSDSDAKRLVDFAAGLSFGLHGSIERVTTAVFLLSPAHVEIGVDVAETNTDQRFFNQA